MKVGCFRQVVKLLVRQVFGALVNEVILSILDGGKVHGAHWTLGKKNRVGCCRSISMLRPPVGGEFRDRVKFGLALRACM
jgi:hypothetical protein